MVRTGVSADTGGNYLRGVLPDREAFLDLLVEVRKALDTPDEELLLARFNEEYERFREAGIARIREQLGIGP